MGILADLLIDGVVIGIGTALDLAIGLRLAVVIGIAQLPMTFVATAVATRRGVPQNQRRVLLLIFFATVLVGAMLGFLVLRNQSETLSLVLIAGAAGVLITAVTQVMIPEAVEAIHNERPSLTGILFLVGLGFVGLAKIVIE